MSDTKTSSNIEYSVDRQTLEAGTDKLAEGGLIRHQIESLTSPRRHEKHKSSEEDDYSHGGPPLFQPDSDASDAADDKPSSDGWDPLERKFGRFLAYTDDKVKVNDRAVSAKFIDTHPVAFDDSKRAFFAYVSSEGIWRPIPREELIRQVELFVLDLARAIDAGLIPLIHLLHVKAIVERLRYDSKMGSPPESTRCLIAVKNGVLDLSGESPLLKAHSKDLWFKHCVPVEYVTDSKPNKFLETFLEPAMASAEDRSLLQRDLGRMLFPGNAAQRVSLLIGKGGSGKSALTSILEEMLGSSSMGYLRTSLLGTRFETQSFADKTYLMAKDVPPNFLLTRGAALLKSLTGADLMQSEQKYAGMQSLKGNFYVMVTANSRLCVKIQGDEEAWRRRLIIHHFSREQIVKPDPHLAQQLIKKEGPGILNWLIEGYLAHRTELGNYGGFVLSDAQKRRVEDLLEESDSIRVFVKKKITKGNGSFTSEEIYQAYCNDCDQKGWSALSEQEFTTELPKLMSQFHGVKRRHDIRGTKRGFKGIVLRGEEGSVLSSVQSTNLETEVVHRREARKIETGKSEATKAQSGKVGRKKKNKKTNKKQK